MHLEAIFGSNRRITNAFEDVLKPQFPGLTTHYDDVYENEHKHGAVHV